MRPLPHNYHVDLTGGPSGYGTLSGIGLPDLTTAPPRQYDGPGDAWSAEHLLLAAISSCFLFTFRAVARALQVESVDVHAHTSGFVTHVAGVPRFVEIVVRASVTVAAGSNVPLLRRAIDKTIQRCLVSSTLTVKPRVEVTICTVGESVPGIHAPRLAA